MPGIGIGLSLGLGGGGGAAAWSEADIARILAASGLNDASARAAIGGAASLPAGLRAVGLLPSRAISTPTPAVTPLPTGIVAMWDAASLSGLADGAPVTSWTDKVAGVVAGDAGDTLTPHSYLANSGGLPAVRLNMGSVLATTGTNAAATAMSGQDYTFLVVARNIQDQGAYDHTNPQSIPCLASSGTGTGCILTASSTQTGRFGFPTPCADPGMRTIAYSQKQSASPATGVAGIDLMGINGTAIATNSGGSSGGGGQVYIGGWQNRGQQCCGKADVLAVIVWNRALTAAELKQVHRRYCELLGQARPGGGAARIVSYMGDSLTAGYQDGSDVAAQFIGSYPYRMATALGLPWGTWDQLGVVGDNWPGIGVKAAVSIGNVSAATGSRSIVCLFEFANTRQAAGSVVAAAARQVIDALHAGDGDREIVFGTSTDDGTSVGVATRQNRTDYDAYWDSAANRSGIAAYVQLHLDPLVGQEGAGPTTGTGNAYFQNDGLHMKPAGYARLDDGPNGFRAAVQARLAA